MAITKEVIDQLVCLFLEDDDNARYLSPTTREERAAIVACCQGRTSGAINQAIVLMKARTDTNHFHAIPSNGTRLCFVNGRIILPGYENGAPFPSLIVYFGDEGDRFARYFDGIGHTLEIRSSALVDWRDLETK